MRKKCNKHIIILGKIEPTRYFIQDLLCVLHDEFLDIKNNDIFFYVDV